MQTHPLNADHEFLLCQFSIDDAVALLAALLLGHRLKDTGGKAMQSLSLHRTGAHLAGGMDQRGSMEA